MVFRRSLINETRRCKMYGPKVSNNIMSGPRRVEIKMVNQGERWNQDLNQPCWAFCFFFCWAILSLTFWRDFCTTPECWYRNSIFFSVLYIIFFVVETTNLNLSYFVTLLQPRSSRINEVLVRVSEPMDCSRGFATPSGAIKRVNSLTFFNLVLISFPPGQTYTGTCL